MISQATVSRIIREIEAGNAKIDHKPTRVKRAIIKRQFGHIHRIAIEAWEKSCEDEIETTVFSQNCSVCNGTGEIGTDSEIAQVCSDCQGTGKIETHKTKIRKRTGDSSYLKIAVDCIRESGKLEGSYKDGKGSKMTVKRLLAESKKVGGEIQTRVEEIYAEVPTDLILKAKQTIEELQKSAELTEKPIEVENLSE